MNVFSCSRVVLVGVLLAVLVVLSGCKARTGQELVVNVDGSGSIAVVFALDEELRAAFDSDDSTRNPMDELSSNVPPGWVAEPYVDEGFEGVRLVATFGSPDDLQAKLAGLAAANGDESPTGLSPVNAGSVVLTVSESEAVVVFSYPPSADPGVDGGFGGVDPEVLLNLFEVFVEVSLPGEVVEYSSGVLTDANTVRWVPVLSMEGLGVEEFRVRSTLSSDSVPVVVVVVTGVLLVIGVLMLWRHRSRSQVWTRQVSQVDGVLTDADETVGCEGSDADDSV